MNDNSELATETIVQHIIEQLHGEGRVSITVAGMPNSIPVTDAVSSGGVLTLIDGPNTLYVKEGSIIAVEVKMPMDLSGLDFSPPPAPNYNA